ncbi:uncharacterized protein LOC111087779 [Limulus polyphemus]|uniref:Uncharacterized protein LOC111087779 n=1 Tax=Limulus polyphemus TaxID=6850 RepID=A0ABM1T627_LIMPO|nr:uncharacterized protein LOC111087779 [Limulus polyphemus]
MCGDSVEFYSIRKDDFMGMAYLKRRLQSSPDTFLQYKRLYEDEKFKKMDTGTYAVFGWSSELLWFMHNHLKSKNRCHFRTPDKMIEYMFYGIPLNKDLTACIKSSINKSVQRLVEFDLFKKWLDDTTFYHKFCQYTPDTTTRPWNLTNLRGVFYSNSSENFIHAKLKKFFRRRSMLQIYIEQQYLPFVFCSNQDKVWHKCMKLYTKSDIRAVQHKKESVTERAMK